MKKNKKTASRILAAMVSTAFTLNFTPFAVFAEQIDEIETITDFFEAEEETFQDNETVDKNQNDEQGESVSEEESSVVVENVKNYQISINNPAPNSCNVTTTNTTVTDSDGNEESFISFKINITDTEDKHYLIKSVQFGSQTLLDNPDGQTEFEQNDILLTDEIADENGNIALNIELKQQYQVTFDYNTEYGTLLRELDEENTEQVFEPITLNEDDTAAIKAVPFENYRVAEVIIDGNTTAYDENDCSPEFELEANQNHTVEVRFKQNRICVSGDYSDGEIRFCYQPADVEKFNPADYAYGRPELYLEQDAVGGTIIACIKPNVSQFIENITVNGEPYQGTPQRDENGYYLFYLDNITQDTHIAVQLKEIPLPSLVLPELEEGLNCYSSDVVLKIESEFSEFVSGEYWIDGTGNRMPIDMSAKEIVISKETRGQNLIVCAEFYEKYGQSVVVKSEPFSLNAIEPKVGIKFEQEAKENAEPELYEKVTATIQINDRADTFPSKEQFVSFFSISKDGHQLSDEEKKDMIQYNREHYDSPNIDGIEYNQINATLSFTEDGVYEWSFLGYTNLAGMRNIGETINGNKTYKFTIDNTSPEGEITISGKEWYKKLLEKLTFGLYDSGSLSVDISSQDADLKSREYFVSNDKTALTEEELKNCQDWLPYHGTFELNSPDYYVIYARIMDKAGNITYLSPKGMMIASNGKCDVDFLMNGEPFEDKIYTSDLDLQVSVQDNRTVPSGIQNIEYWFSKNDEQQKHQSIAIEENSNLEQEFPVHISAQEYNGADAVLHVKVTDTVGKETEETQRFQIDTDKPEIEFSYKDKEGKPIDGSKLKVGERLVIQVTEQNFDQQKAEETIKINGISLSNNADSDEWRWGEKNETPHWTKNGNTYTTEVVFLKKGDYAIEAICTDKAGLSSEKHTSFKVENEPITFEIDGKYEKGPYSNNEYYHDDVTVTINVENFAPLTSIEYWVTVDGEKKLKNSFSKNYKPEDNKTKFSKQITVTENSSNIKLFVEIVDSTGEKYIATQPLDIDKDDPKIEISYDNNDGQEHDGEYYFNQDRTATIRFTERREHFNPEKAKDSIQITGENWSLGNCEPEKKENGDTIYTLPVYFHGECEYHLAIDGRKVNISEEKGTIAAYDFTIDKTAPTGELKAESDGRIETWTQKDFDNPLTFNFWSNMDGINVYEAQNVEDNLSTTPIIQYYSSSSIYALTKEELDKVKDWKNEIGDICNEMNERFTVYCKISDYAGNVTYLKTNGLINDDSKPEHEMSAPEITLTDAETGEEFEGEVYNGDVNVSIKVDDPLVNDSYSGLKSISYKLLNMGKEISSDVLYTFDQGNPQYSDLQKDWEHTIIVDSEDANSNDVVLEIYAMDNAMNESVERLPLQIDTTPPEISVEFDNNFSSGMSSSSRTARISVKERNFDPELVKLYAARNGEDLAPTVIWSQTEGTENGDDTMWYTDVPFSGDGAYTFSIYCMDTAGNLSNQVIYGESGFTSYAPSDPENPFHFGENNVVEVEPIIFNAFTVDTTNPIINVIFSDDSASKKGSYYQGGRTATITINETNFNKEKATQGISVRGTEQGKAVNAVVSDWKDNGDSHIATVRFSDDAEYSMNISYTDEAGNAGAAFHEDFYVDTIDPDLNISVNNQSEFNAYAGEVIPVIRFEDANFDAEQVKVDLSGSRVTVSEPTIKDDTISFKLTGTNDKSRTWKGKFENIISNGKINGKILTFEDFPSVSSKEENKAFDDIYTFTVSLKDKADRSSNSANPEKNSMTFSVNRCGSTYDISKIQTQLNSYIQELDEVVISEINPNELQNDTRKVNVFIDGEETSLKEGENYTLDVSGEEKEWHEYTYRIHGEEFEKDGSYEIQLNSVDKAGNKNSNTFDSKSSNIRFTIDKTPPTAIIANLENNHAYYVDENQMLVFMQANDNLKLSEVNVYLDKNKDESPDWHWNEQEIETEFNDGEFTFEIEAEPLLSSKSHQLTVICKDASGRENEPVVIDGFKIIVNESVKPWIFVGIGAGAAAIAAAAAVILHKRRKNNV